MGLATELYDLVNIAKREGWFDRLISRFRKRHRVLLLGSSGCGKTQIRGSIYDFTQEAIDFMSRTEAPVRERPNINKHLFEFTDLPGDVYHSARRMPEIRTALRTGVDGIINVVAYGYHEYGIRRVSEAVRPDGHVVEEYLEKHREREILDLQEWWSIIGNVETTQWILTIVNKADLWWGNENEIMQYYKKGPYRRALGSAGVPLVTTPYCSVVHKFYSRGRVSGAFDDQTRLRLRSDLFRVLLELVGKGHNRD